MGVWADNFAPVLAKWLKWVLAIATFFAVWYVFFRLLSAEDQKEIVTFIDKYLPVLAGWLKP
jgi:hypothetical protein